MKLKNEQEYQDWKAKNPDPYGNRCFTYAEDWANLMEKHMEDGITLEECAENDSHIADTDGITGFMYGMAVSILHNCWEYGEQLRIWHNLKTQLSDEGVKANKAGKVLNPALLRVE